MTAPPQAARALAPRAAELAAQAEAERRLPAELSAELAARRAVPALRPGRPGRRRGAARRAARGGRGARRRRRGRGLVRGRVRDRGDARRVPRARGGPRGLGRAVRRRRRRVRPDGRARTREGDALSVGGRWRFCSNVANCDWLMGGCVVADGGAPRLLESGRPDIRLVLMPAAEVEVIDTWTVSGLRATGSHDIAVEGLAVPAARSASLITDAPRERGPLYAFPPFGLLAAAIAAVALGIARGALDDLAELAGAKTPTLSTRKLAERAATQSQLARAEAALRAARSLLYAQHGARLGRGGRRGRDPGRAARGAAARLDPRGRGRGGGRRRRLVARRRQRDLRDRPARAALSRRPRGDPAHARRPGDVGAHRALPARARVRRLAAMSARYRRLVSSAARAGRGGARRPTRRPDAARTAPGGRPTDS